MHHFQCTHFCKLWNNNKLFQLIEVVAVALLVSFASVTGTGNDHRILINIFGDLIRRLEHCPGSVPSFGQLFCGNCSHPENSTRFYEYPYFEVALDSDSSVISVSTASGTPINIYFVSDTSKLQKSSTQLIVSADLNNTNAKNGLNNEHLKAIFEELISKFGDQFNPSLNSNLFFAFIVQNESENCRSQFILSTPSVWEYYKIAGKSILNQIELCDFEITNVYSQVHKKRIRRKNFHGANIRITVANDSTGELEVKYTTDTDGTFKLLSGSAVSVLWDLQVFLNFTYSVLVGDWITRFPNGTLRGITYSQLKNGSADMQISLPTMLPYRAAEFSFLQPTYYGGVKVFFLQPPSRYVRDIYMEPFQFQLWAGFFLTWFLILCCLRLVAVIQKYCSSLTEIPIEDNKTDETLDESFMWAVGVTCQQSWHKSPPSTALRIVFLSGTLTGFVSYIAYVAAIVSALSTQVVPINSFLNLLDSTFQIYAANDSSTMSYIIQNLRKERNQPDLGIYVSVREGVEISLVEDGQCAFLAFSHHFYRTGRLFNVSDQAFCKLSVLPVNNYPYQSAMLVTKNSPYRGHLNYGIIRLKEIGLNFRYMANYARDTSSSCVKRRVQRSRLGFKDVFTAYIILITGYCSSLIILFCERLLFMTKAVWIVK